MKTFLFLHKWWRDIEVFANFSDENIDDFTVSGN